MFNLLRKSLFTRILSLFVATSLICVILVGVTTDYITSKSIQSQLSTTTLQTVTQLQAMVETYFTANGYAIDEISNSSEIKNYYGQNNKSAVLSVLNDKLKSHPDYMALYIGRSDGSMDIIPSGLLPPGFDATTRSWYKSAVAKKGTIWTDPYVDAITGKMIVTVSEALKDSNGNLIGVAGADIALDQINSFLKDVKLGSSGEAFIIDKSGVFVTDPKIIKLKKDRTVDDSQNLSNIIKEITSKQQSNKLEQVTINGQKKYMEFFTNQRTGWKFVALLDSKELTSITSKISFDIFAMVLLAAVISILSSLKIINSIKKPISNLDIAMHSAAKGDLTTNLDVTSDDELGVIQKTFNKMLTSQRELMNKVIDSSEVVSSASEQISSTTEEMTATAQNQANIIQGFTVTVEEMDHGIHDTTTNVGRLTSNVVNVSKAAEEMGNAIQETSKNIQETVQVINTVAKSIEQMGESITVVAKNSKEAQSEAEVTVSKANEGNRAVENAIKEMDKISRTFTEFTTAINKLGNSAEKIGNIVEVIDDISEQTNLLSLNASIEAARAGDAGKGFAVVANSIRNLAERSSEATQDIAKLIEGIQKEVQNTVILTGNSTGSVKEGVSQVKETERVFEDIFKAIDKTSRLIREIAESIVKQDEGSKEIVKSSEKMNELISQLSATTEQQAAGSDEIVKAMEQINDLMHQVSATIEEQAASSQDMVKLIQGINKGTSDVSAGSEEIATSTTNLAKETQNLIGVVKQFKVK